jgi:hypothetical protein
MLKSWTRAGEQRVEKDDEGAKLGAGDDIAKAEESDGCGGSGEGEHEMKKKAVEAPVSGPLPSPPTLDLHPPHAA